MAALREGGMTLPPSRRAVSATRCALGSTGVTGGGGATGTVWPTGGSGCGTGIDGGTG